LPEVSLIPSQWSEIFSGDPVHSNSSEPLLDPLKGLDFHWDDLYSYYEFTLLFDKDFANYNPALSSLKKSLNTTKPFAGG